MANESIEKISAFFSDGQWHTREGIVRGTGLSDAEINEAMKTFFDMEEAEVVRDQRRPLVVYRMPPKQLDMFGNEVI